MQKLLIAFFIINVTFFTPLGAADKKAHDLLAAKNFAYVLAAGGAFIFTYGCAQYIGWISTSSPQTEKPTPQPPVQGLEGIPTTPSDNNFKITPAHRMAVGACFTLIIAPLWYLFNCAHTSISSPNGYLNYCGRLSRLQLPSPG